MLTFDSYDVCNRSSTDINKMIMSAKKANMPKKVLFANKITPPPFFLQIYKENKTYMISQA